MALARSIGFAVALFAILTEGSTLERRPNPRNCGEADMCCQGQNNTCFVFGQRVDRSEDSARCYCDSNCLIMGDCCMDYHHHCKSEYFLLPTSSPPPLEIKLETLLIYSRMFSFGKK
ncbi:hypothetical protein BgiMline_027715 [Biomphalaria glabrata]|nr:hypothetical protein BgiMline_013583 [Biomphalaria glabrata]